MRRAGAPYGLPPTDEHILGTKSGSFRVRAIRRLRAQLWAAPPQLADMVRTGLDALPLCSTPTRWSVLKTYLAGWTTSRRMHERMQLPCLYGCLHAADQFGHYLECPALRVLASESLGLRLAGDWMHEVNWLVTK